MTVQAAAFDLAEDPAGRDRWKQPIWLLLGAAAYFLLGLLGRLTIAEGQVMSLVWPAAGVGVLLFGMSTRRWWLLVGVLVGLATVGLNLVTGASLTQVWVFIVSNLAQALAAVLLLRAWAPHLRGAGGDRPIESIDDFWPVLAASVGASLLGGVIGVVGRGLLIGGWSWTDLFVWWGRNSTGCVVIVTTCLLVLTELPRWRHSRSESRARVEELVRTRGPEALLLVLATVVVYGLVLVWYPSLPIAFPLLAPTVWVGLRFAPLPVALHSLAVCAVVVVFTLRDDGAFAAVSTWNGEVLVSQLFIGMVFCLGTLLSLGRGERLALTGSLSSTRAASEGQARVLSTIIDGMHDGVSVIDETGLVTRRNPAGAEMTRTDADRVNNVRDSTFTMMTTDGRVLRSRDYPWVRAIAGETIVDQDIVLVFDDGSPSRTLALSARLLPTLDERGRQQAVVIYHDVTADRAQRTALESFAHVVAHDLHGPLGVIDGWTEMLASDLESEGSLSLGDAEPKLGRIKSAAAGMHRLIDDLLDTSISREQQLRSTVVDLESLARSVTEQRVGVTAGPQPDLQVGALPDVYADAALVRQLLDNLVGNAVKYVVPGEQPHVRITAREVGELVEVTVADEGIGIPASERDRIFETYHRAHSSEGYEGHGIGLSVCKKIVERHGGRIAARPAEGPRGTRIVLTLPGASAASRGGA